MNRYVQYIRYICSSDASPLSCPSSTDPIEFDCTSAIDLVTGSVPQLSETESGMHEQPTAGTCTCKVGKAITGYGLTDLDETLRERRVRDTLSLRDLADLVNQAILEAAIEQQVEAQAVDVFGLLDPDDVIESLYDALTDESTASDRTARITSRLRQIGVDLDDVRQSWVTHPTVRSHLRDCLDLDTSTTADLSADDARRTIDWARNRCLAIVKRTIERLANAGRLTITDVDVSLTVMISCATCNETYRPARLIERGGCRCRNR